MFTSDATSARPSAAKSSLAMTPQHAEVAERVRRPDAECRARAREFLSNLIGAPPDGLCWDRTHRLQGHTHLGGRELVVIAPRDEAHCTVVLTAHDWEHVRRADTGQRRALLGACAIGDRSRLNAVLASPSSPATP